MSYGHRVFIVEGDEISSLSQKAAERFYFRHEPVLQQFAGRSVDIATAFYKLRDRRPSEIVRIDLQRHKVKPDGSIDEEHEREAGRLFVNRMDRSLGWSESEPVPGVINASVKFDQRRLSAKHLPKLSGPAHKKIIDALFGHRN